MKLRAVLIAAALVALLAPARTAFACSCAEVNEQESFAGADAVFTGTVSATRDGNGGPIFGGADSIEYRFDVEGVEKGDVLTPTVLTSSRDSAACGYVFDIGSRYRVFAYSDEGGGLSTNLCSPTAETDEILGAPPISGQSENGGASFPLVPAVAIGGVAAAAAAFLLLRRRASGDQDGGVVP